MSYMFNGSSKLQNLGNLDDWNTSKVTDMNSMFQEDSDLTNIGDLSKWNTSKVTDMNSMFNKASNLINIGDLSNWDTSNVTTMAFMFNGASKLQNLGNLDDWNTSKVTDMNTMFQEDSDLTNIGDLSKWNTSKVTNMGYMFNSASKLQSLGNLDDWDTSKVTNMIGMFNGTSNLKSIGDLSKWNTSNVIDMSFMFSGASKLQSLGNLDDWDTSKVTNMLAMFQGASGLTTIGELSKWNTSNVTDMGYMFSGVSNLQSLGNLDDWNTSKVTNMTAMFQNDSGLTNIGNLSKWDTSKVTDMSDMFLKDSKLANIGDLSKWNTSKVTDMSYMFMNNAALKSLNISNWDLTHLLDWFHLSGIFIGANDLVLIANDLKLPTWYTPVTDVNKYFADHMAVVTNNDALLKSTGANNTITIDNTTTTRPIFYQSNGSSDAVAVLKQVDQDYIKKYSQTHSGYALSLATTLDQTNPLALANAEFTSSKVPQTFKINFVDDASGKVIASSSVEQALVDTTLTLDAKELIKLIPEHYYFTDSGYSIPTSFNYQHVTDNLTIHLTKAPVYTFNLVDDTSNKTNSTLVWDGIDNNHHFTGTVSELNQKIKQVVNAVQWKNAPGGEQHGDSPKSVNLLTTVTDLTALPTHDTTQTVHFVHSTHSINEAHDVSQVIHYVYQNGSKALDNHIDSVHFVRDGYHDEFDNTDHWNSWMPSDNYHFAEVHSPKIQGFTSDIQFVDQVTVNPSSQNIEKTVTYHGNVQLAHVKYVDDSDNGRVMSRDDLSGHTGEIDSYTTSKNIKNYTSQGYVFVSDNYPATGVVFDNNDLVDQYFEVHFKHGTTTVTPDHPQANGTELSNNPKQSFHGVESSDLNKTIIRTIKITQPDGTVTNKVQTAKLTRNADVDEVTGEVTYSDWTTGYWSDYTAPSVPGYTASPSRISGQSVTGATQDQTVNITYTANDHQISVKYVDDDQGEKVVGTGTVNGKTGTEVTITPSLPKGYMLTQGKDSPSTYIVTVGDNQVVTIHVQKQFVDTSATDPQAKQTRAVTLHYVYGAGDKQGQKAFDDAVLNVYYHRTATLDRATNKTTYGDWLWDQSQGDPSMPGYHVVSGKWTNLPQHWANVIADVPSIKGYHTDLGQNDPANTNHVPANIWVYPTWNGAGSAGETLDNHESKAYQTSARLYEVQPEHTVKYMPNKTTLTVKYIDDDNKGAVVGSQHWDGTTGQHIDLTLMPPDNYVLSPGWVNPTNYDFDGVNNAWYNVHVKHAVQTQTVTSQLTIHYVNSEDHSQELKAPTVITRQYTRTNVSHNDGTTQYGDWSYIPGSFKQTGTQITVNDSDSPVKEDNVYNADENENMDGFTMIARYPTIEDYAMHDGISGARSTDWLGNSDRQAATMTDSIYAEYDEHKERSIAVKFVDDQHDEQQVGQVTTVTGRDGDTVDLKLTVPDKYQLADGRQLPTTYTFKKGSDGLEIHVVHQVVQREATADVQMGLIAAVRVDDGDLPFVVTQNQWTQLDDKIKDYGQPYDKAYPSVKVGTVTGHVGYDLVDNKVVSFGDDWTTLNLGGQTYQMPDGTEAVNGIFVDYYPGSYGKPFKEELLKYHPDVDPDYSNRPWHGYLSVNATNKEVSDLGGDSLQSGLAGNEPNTLAKANGDQAATAVKSANKTVDLSLLQRFGFETRDFSEQNGRLQGIAELDVVGVYIPYVEKTATRTINVTTPDGKTTSVKQTATLAKQVDFGKDAHPVWTTGEWTNYDVPVIPGYTASQSQVAKETVTGETKDQTIEITYTANPQTTTVVYQTEDGTPVHTTTVNGKTGQTVKVSSEVPAGWHVVNGNVPSEITFGPDGAPKTVVTIDHSHVTVTPDTTKTTSDKLPDNPGKSYPAGVGETDLNKTVTGTIKVTMPDGQIKTILKTAKLTRTADVDEVTGAVKYSDWSTGYWSDYTAPVVPGYTANYPYIAGQAVTGVTQDQTIEINYTANPQTTHVNYVDGNGKVVHATTVNGHTNQTVDVPNEVPTGWKLVDGQTVPNTITFGANGHADTSVTIEHRHVMVTPDHPQTNGTKLPDNPAQSFHGVEASDLNKTATRTIKVTTPDGQTKTVTQTVKLTRTATVDEVTGDVSYGKWTTGQWDKYDVPAVNGYTATQTEVAATAVDEHITDQTVNISYTANPQTTTVKYVDDKGDVVHTTTVNGVTNQTVKVPSEVPAGWTITKGQVPSELTFGVDGHEPIEVTVAHHHVTVDPDQPQTDGTKLPDNPAKTFNGVEENDLNKTITRTIKVTTPDGKTTTTKQTAKLTRTADVDEVTGEVTYGNWTTGQWAVYDVPSVAGYTPSQAKVNKETVTAASKDTTTTITYTPNQHQISVEYVDDDNHGKIVKTNQVPGKTDQTITITPSAPANYDLVDNGNRTYAVTSADGQAVQIHVKHHQVTTSESKIVTRTINVHTPHNGVKTVKQTVELNRDVTTDQVTGEKTYGDWTTGQWKAYAPEAIPGYTLSTNDVPSANVNGNSTDQTVDVIYTANTQHVDIVYFDDAKGGAVVKTDQVAGKTDEAVKVTPNVPTGYKVVGEVPGSYTMTTDGHQTITVHLVHQMKTASESKSVTRTIDVDTPHDGTTVFKQTVDLSRDVTTDQATGDKTYGDWSTTEWTHYDVPAVAGYTPSMKQVAQQDVDGTTEDQTVNVTYTANAQTTHVSYVDGDGNVVHTTTVTGKTDQTVKVPNETPAGWKVVGESVPTEITFGPDGHDAVTVTVGHQHVTVTPDQPKTPADKLPNNPGKTYPDGVGHDNLNKTVTRTIKVVTPDGQTKTVTQKVQLTRNSDVDEVTGEVTYGKWTTGQWDTYEVPSQVGYTASQTIVAVAPVDGNTKDQTVDVYYTANSQTTHINYVDGNGETVHTTAVTGKTGETVKVPNEVPAGWMITNGKVSSEITFGPNGYADETITIGHQRVTVDPDHPQTNGTKLPDNPAKTFNGVEANDLNKIITRTIKVTTPDGKVTTTKQTAKLIRNAEVDEVTGKVTYGKWTTGQWDAYEVPSQVGYTASQTSVAATLVDGNTNDQTIDVYYTANSQTTHINYVDVNGETVHTTAVTGKTGETVKVPNEVPAGWMITNGKVPSEITFGPNGYSDETITIGHRHVTVDPDHPQTNGIKLPDNPAKTFNSVEANDLNKTITRTIKVTAPDGKLTTTKQTAKLTRTANVDEVTGAVTYGDWTTAEWSAFIVPSVPGYTPSQKTISSITVKSGDKDVEETVIYSPNKQVMMINYIDDVTGKTLSTKQIIGVSDASANYNTKSSINSYVAGHYKLVSDDTNSDNLVFDHNDSINQVYNVHLTHTYQTVDDRKAVNETVHYVYDNGQMARPDYKSPAINFSRTGTKDLVTSNIVWNAWTPAEQSFDQVITPAISGYTPDVEVVPSINVNHGSADVERTVIYHADDQTILVNYIDDDTHSTLKTDTVIGKTSQKSNYTTKKSIDGYIADHYELVSDDTNDSELVFDSDSTKGQVYNVHLKHAHQNVSDSALVNETIHYIYADGSKVSDDYHAPAISFKRTGDKDLVTNHIVWNAWTPASQDFKAVDSPVIDGYTPSQKTISSIAVKPGDKDVDQTVVYAPDTQSIVVNYIDDVVGKTLKTDTLTGKSDLVSDYTTKNNITGYENQHYVLVSDDTQGKTLTFDHNDKSTQVYNVHLSHQTESASQSRTVHETIDYVYADGSKAADTVTANPLTFIQTGVKDLVTGNIDWNGTWTSKQTFVEVKSPEIIGYTSSRKVVDPIIVDHNSSDIHQTVIYVANNQTAKIKYIDDVTGKTFETDSFNGKFGDQINFGHDVDTQIKSFEGQGYKFKSNSFNGQKYQSDNSQNEFEVHFTHGTQNVSRTNKVTETVKYQFADGRQAQKAHVQTAEFTQHGVQDLVTKTTVWTSSDPQTFVSVDTPHITGYTEDVQNVPAVTVNFGDGDIIKVVTYKANDQLAGIKYIDDTTGKTLDTEAASGKFGTKIEFMHDQSSMIQKFEGQGYKLVSNSFKYQDYQADNSENQFEVHFTHGTQTVSRTDKVTETVKYQFADARQAQRDHVQTVKFTQHGVQDLVTKTTVWTISDPQYFVSVDSPKIIGYTADVQKVPAVTVNFGDTDITKVVTYKANDQLAGIKYIDDTTGKMLDTDSSNGKFGDQIKFGHDVDMQIKAFEGQGYKFVSNSFKDQDYQADNSKNQFEVHFKHGMKDVSRTSTITRTIKYVDQNTGKEVYQPVIQTLTFTENGLTDLVTGKTTWETPSDQQFVKVESPKIDGYENPDIPVVDSETAKFGDGDQTVTVRYQKVEVPSTSDNSKEPNNSLTPSVSSTKNESNISTMSMHTPTQVGSQTASDQQIVNNHDESQLPQTGNQNSHQAGLIGLMSLTLAGLLGFGKRRKKND